MANSGNSQSKVIEWGKPATRGLGEDRARAFTVTGIVQGGRSRETGTGDRTRWANELTLETPDRGNLRVTVWSDEPQDLSALQGAEVTLYVDFKESARYGERLGPDSTVRHELTGYLTPELRELLGGKSSR